MIPLSAAVFVMAAAQAAAPQTSEAPTAGQAPAGRTSRISDESVQRLDVENYPKRPRPIVEIGPAFLGTGNIRGAFTLPTGAVWQPQLIAFGTYSSAIQGVRSPTTGRWTNEWVNRLDLFSNLQLSGTERLLVGVRPLDAGSTASGFDLSRGVSDRLIDATRLRLSALFFEGDFGEIFPHLDRRDRGRLDIGFSVGRQPLAFQDGILINDDAVDAVGVTRNTILPRGGSNVQLTGLYGWGALHGSDNVARPRSRLAGVVTTADLGKSSFNAEVFHVGEDDRDGGGVFWGLSRTRRHGYINTTLRALGSYALGGRAGPAGLNPAVGTGHLLFAELSTTPAWTHDLLYLNLFAAAGTFTSAARGPGTGGPLGRAGILFAATGYGRYPAPLSNRAKDVAGGSLGYQKFLSPLHRAQIVFELDGRWSRDALQETAVAAGTRFQRAFGRHTVLQLDGFAKYARAAGTSTGARLEMRLEF